MEHLRPEKDGRSWIVTPKDEGWVFERTYPTKWKAHVAISVWHQGGSLQNYFEAAREEKKRRRQRAKKRKKEKAGEEEEEQHSSESVGSAEWNTQDPSIGESWQRFWGSWYGLTVILLAGLLILFGGWGIVATGLESVLTEWSRGAVAASAMVVWSAVLIGAARIYEHFSSTEEDRTRARQRADHSASRSEPLTLSEIGTLMAAEAEKRAAKEKEAEARPESVKPQASGVEGMPKTDSGGSLLQTIRDWYRRFLWWRYNRRVRRTLREDMRWAAGKRARRPPPLPPPPPFPGQENPEPRGLSETGESGEAASPRLRFAIRYAPGSPGALAREMANTYSEARLTDPSRSHRELMRETFESRLESGTEKAIEHVLDNTYGDMARLVEMILGAENRWGVGDLADDLSEINIDALAGQREAILEVKAKGNLMSAVRNAVKAELDEHLPQSAPRPWKDE